MIMFYGYAKCSTCTKAKKALAALGVEFREIDITDTPPPKKVLKALLADGEYRLADIFNRSGVQYRELNMKEKLPTMTEAQALDLLSQNGRLCKRPVVTDGQRQTVGYKPEFFESTWG